MNQKAAYSVLFCALLASTFVHELQAKGVAPVSSRQHHNALLSRAGSSQVCSLSCNFNNEHVLNVTLEVINNLLVVANYSASAALVIDVSAQIVLVLNGTTGAGVAINIAKQVGVSFNSGLWVGGAAELSAFINASLSSGLAALWNLSGAISFSVASITTAALTIIANVLIRLVVNVAVQIRANLNSGLQLLLQISSQIISVIAGKLSGLISLIGAIRIKLHTDLSGLLLKLLTLNALVVAAAGSLSALIAAGVLLDLALILGAKNGIIAFANLILQFGASATIAAALGAYLTSAAVVLVILRGLGGGLSVGVNGILSVAAAVAELTSNATSLEVVITKVIQVTIGNSLVVSLSEEFNASVSGLVSAVAQISASSSLSVVATVASNLQAGALVIGGVSISAIISGLLAVYAGASVALLGSIVATVYVLKAIRAEYQLAVYLILVLFAKLSIQAGIIELIALGLAISFSFNLASVLSASFSLIWALLTGSIYNGLKAISGIGTIVTAIAGAWAGGVSAFATFLVQGSAYIYAWFQVVSGISLGASASALASVGGIIQAATNVTHYTSLSYTASFSISAGGGGAISG